MSNERFSYKVIANVGVLAQYPTGWSKEVNIVSWNEGQPELDIRDWSENREKMSRGSRSQLMRRRDLLTLFRQGRQSSR